MEHIIYMHNKKHKLNLLSLIGSFLFFAGLLGLIIGISDLYQQSSAMYNLNECYAKASINNISIDNCKTNFYQITGQSLSPTQTNPNSSQKINIIFRPIINILLWITLSLFGIFLYKLGDHIIRLYKEQKTKNTNKRKK